MATYQKKGAGYALPQFGNVYQEKISVPDLIAAGSNSGLALTSAPNVGVALPSTGFADGDILEIFWVPKGTVVRGVGLYVITAEGAQCTIDVGVQSSTETNEGQNIDTWIDGGDLNAAAGTYTMTGSIGEASDDLFMGEVIFETNGSIDIEFNDDNTGVTEFVIWAEIIPLDYSLFGF
jgi:hypothetical protein